MAKGKRFDSMQDVYNKALLERYGLIHYIHAIEKFVKSDTPKFFRDFKLGL